jgi:hypothetical protein
MLEHMGSGHQDLYDDLSVGMNSAWQQFTLAYPQHLSGGGDYFLIDQGNPTNPRVIMTQISEFLSQYFRFIRRDALRIKATTNDGRFEPLAFINADGNYVVVVKSSTGGSISIEDLPAGTYGIKYTTNSQYDVGLADQIINPGEAVNANIPSAGVITVYAKTLGPVCILDSDCDDSQYCNGAEECSGTCQPGPPPCTDDGFSCTVLCDETLDECNDPDDAACDDGNICTDDSCVGAGGDAEGCSYTNNSDNCDDGIACTENDACGGGKCTGTPNNDLCVPLPPGCTSATCAVIQGCVYQPAGCSVPGGLVLWLKLDGDMTDSSGFNNDAACVNCPALTSDKNGNPDSAYDFNGVDDSVYIANDNTLDAEDMTVSFWVKTSDTGDSLDWWGSTFIFDRDQPGFGNPGWAVTLGNGDGTVVFVAGDNDLQSNTDIGDDAWHHVALLKNSTHKYIFIDGVKDNSEPDAGTISNNEDIYIGSEGGNDDYFNGIIDEVKIYNKTLTTQEILSLYEEKTCHQADTDCNACVVMNEIVSFIGDWKQGLQGITLIEVMDGIRLYSTGGPGCP